jgi:hypothetical protein
MQTRRQIAVCFFWWILTALICIPSVFGQQPKNARIERQTKPFTVNRVTRRIDGIATSIRVLRKKWSNEKRVVQLLNTMEKNLVDLRSGWDVWMEEQKGKRISLKNSYYNDFEDIAVLLKSTEKEKAYVRVVTSLEIASGTLSMKAESLRAQGGKADGTWWRFWSEHVAESRVPVLVRAVSDSPVGATYLVSYHSLLEEAIGRGPIAFGETPAGGQIDAGDYYFYLTKNGRRAKSDIVAIRNNGQTNTVVIAPP